MTKSHLHIADPAKGKYKINYKDFQAKWTHYIVTFVKRDDFCAGNHSSGLFTKFFSLLKGQYKILVSVFIISLFLALVGIGGSFVFQAVIDNFLSVSTLQDNNLETSAFNNVESENVYVDSHESHEHSPGIVGFAERSLEVLQGQIYGSDFNLIFVFVLILYLLGAAVQVLRGYLMASLSKRIDISLVLSSFRSVIGMPVSALHTRQTGDYLSRFSDSSAIRSAISGATISLMLDSMMIIVCSVILINENIEMFWVALAMMAIYLIIVITFKHPIEKINQNVMEQNARVQSYLKESIDGAETVKALCSETIVNHKASDKFTNLMSKIFKGNIVYTVQDTLTGLVKSIGSLLIIWIGFTLVLNNSLSLGSLITFYMLLNYFFTPITNLMELQPQMQAAIVAAERLNDIIGVEIEKIDEPSIDAFEIEDISCKSVNFRYGFRNNVLSGVDIDIKKGQKIAIVGESGSGKTTLAKLLIGFYTPTNGSILINNTNITEYPLDSLRKSIQYLDQNTFFFSDTIRANILLGTENITEADFQNACAISSASEFIKKMPLQYDSFIEENGNNLSGGQKQRLALARALVRKPRVLIMDEATSHLDALTEESVRNAIFSKEMTCIIIAHRLNTIQKCDKIYVMDEGRVIESGSHDELIKNEQHYYKLWNKS